MRDQINSNLIFAVLICTAWYFVFEVLGRPLPWNRWPYCALGFFVGACLWDISKFIWKEAGRRH